MGRFINLKELLYLSWKPIFYMSVLVSILTSVLTGVSLLLDGAVISSNTETFINDREVIRVENFDLDACIAKDASGVEYRVVDVIKVVLEEDYSLYYKESGILIVNIPTEDLYFYVRVYVVLGLCYYILLMLVCIVRCARLKYKGMVALRCLVLILEVFHAMVLWYYVGFLSIRLGIGYLELAVVALLLVKLGCYLLVERKSKEYFEYRRLCDLSIKVRK